MKVYICDRCNSTVDDGQAGSRHILMEGFKFAISPVQKTDEGEGFTEAHLCRECMLFLIIEWTAEQNIAWEQSRQWEEERKNKSVNALTGE